MTKHERSIPALSTAYSIIAVPFNFLVGFIVGLAAPVAAVAAMVAGVRFLTGRLPFLNLGPDTDTEERSLSLELIPEDDARQRFDTEKRRILDDLDSLGLEIKGLIEKAKAEQEAGTES